MSEEFQHHRPPTKMTLRWNLTIHTVWKNQVVVVRELLICVWACSVCVCQCVYVKSPLHVYYVCVRVRDCCREGGNNCGFDPTNSPLA